MDYLSELRNSWGAIDVGATDEAGRSRFLSLMKTFISEKKDELMRMHAEGAGGAGIVAEYSALADALIIFLYSVFLKQPTVRAGNALIALGGYGRKELCFCSDLDIMLLSDGPLRQDVETANVFLITFLWDIGFEVGHSVRSIDEALQLAEKDDVVLTSLMEARLLAGDPAVLDTLRRQVFALVKTQGIKKFIRLKKKERNSDYCQAGSEVYCGEPNIKLTAGGLRDYHTGIWIALARFGLRSLRECHVEGLLTEEQFLRLSKALDFLWRVRNQMHLDNGAPHDVLTLSRQERIAAVFGYEPSRGALPVELFMQDYYAHAAEINRFYWEMLQLGGLLEREGRKSAPPRGGKMERGLRVARRSVFLPANDENWFRENPARLMEIFWHCQKQGYMLSERALRTVKDNLPLVDDRFRASPVVQNYFLAILADPERVGAAVRQLSDIGLLDRYMPEFASIRNVIRYDSFHQYPVHEHTLRALENLATVPRLKEPGTDILKKVLFELKDPAILSLAILLHDFGKGVEGAHVENGLDIAEAIGNRLGLSEDRLQTLRFLIRNHLKMGHLSQYRDIDDVEIIHSFAAEVESEEHLNMLYLLTFADLYAVRQGHWNDWKSALLYHLYFRTRMALDESSAAVEHGYFIDSAKARAVNEYRAGKPFSDVQDHLKLLPERYLRTFTPKEVAEHMAMVASLRRKTSALKCVSLPQYSLSHITVCTRDRLGLFADIAGTFASQQVSILDASIFTRSDGIALDSFYVVDAKSEAPLASTRWAMVKEHLRKVLRGERDVKHLLQRAACSPREAQKAMVSLRRGIHFDNRVSATHTVIDIEAPDRVGLLYDIASTFSALGLNLAVAKVSTDVRQAHDAFYVTDKAHEKITDPLRLQEIKEKIEGVLEWNNPTTASHLAAVKDRRRMKA